MDGVERLLEMPLIRSVDDPKERVEQLFLAIHSMHILYTYDGKHVYRGRYTNTSDILYTWDGKHVYKGRYDNTSDIVYTFDGKHLYRGRYTNTSDILFTVDSLVPIIVLLAALL